MVLELLQYAFFQKAVLVSLMASIAAGIIGTYIVVKRISLITGSIAHSAFGGLGISFYAGINPLLGAGAFSILSAAAIAFFRKIAQNRLDTLLSFLWSAGMAIGLIFIFLTPGYATDLNTFLFGNILLVSDFDLFFILALNIAIIASVVLFYNPFLSVCFDEEYAATRNLPVSLIYLFLFALVAMTVVAVIRVVGIVLMIAILSLPAASAQMFRKTVKGIMILSVLISLLSMISGLLISAILDFPPGPIIVLVTSLAYLISIVIAQIKRR